MRDIKFRVWNGEAMITENVVFLGKSGFAIDLDGMDWDFEFGRFGKPELIGMQYTGLKDKNGVEIYEGDIITAGIRGGNVLSTYSIDFDSIYGCWYGNLIKSEKLGNKDCRPIGELRFNAEVIGNIHQNP